MLYSQFVIGAAVYNMYTKCICMQDVSVRMRVGLDERPLTSPPRIETLDFRDGFFKHTQSLE